MAKPSWLTNTPSSGSGNGSVSHTATSHTGRTARSGSNTYKMTGVSDISQSVSQTGKPEFVTIENTSVSKTGGTVTVSGTSNSSKLTFSLGTGLIVSTLPSSYTAGGTTTSNGTAITGDPGSSAQYNFSISLSATANGSTSQRSQQLTVTANGGQQASATLSQSAGDPSLSINPASITLDWEGAAVSTTVTANGNWTVE